MKRRKRTHQSRDCKSFDAKSVGIPPTGFRWYGYQLGPNTRQRLKREIDREIRSYE